MRLVFDRGTLLLLDAPAGLPVGTLPGALWDPRVRAFRCPGYSLPALRQVLESRNVQVSDETSRHRLDRPAFRTPVELRPYQRAALAAWDLAGRRGVVVLPTGSGKTRLALAAIAQAGEPALCLVPTRVLLEQWVRATTEFMDCEPGVLGDGERTLGSITVATFESAWRQMDRIGNRFGTLIVDEAHHFGSGIRDEALEMCTATLRLGLTATPPAMAAGNRLVELLGRTVFELSVADLAGSFLAPFDNIVIHVDLNSSERADYDQLTRAFRDVMGRFRRFHPGASWDDFVRAAGRTDEGRRAIAAFHRARKLLAFPAAKRAALGRLLGAHAETRTLVFVGDNETAYAVAREHLIMPLTCDIGRKERERALALFAAGKLRALVSAQVLNEGLDVPDAEVGIIVAGHRGEREHVQRIGRLLRPRVGKRAQVYELVVQGSSEERQANRRRRSIAA
jgi:superfamily II DNA or RNA helicase